MQVTLKILRYNPEDSKPPHYDTFVIPDAEPNHLVLDLLERVRGFMDGTLAFRRSCSHGICGSDAMRINGYNRLACKVLVKDLGTDQILVEPLLGLPVLKDLIVNMEPFYEHYRSVLPYFMCPDDPVPGGKERLQTPEQRDRFDDTTRCILCAASKSSISSLACGAAGRFSTAPKPARARSRSPRLSPKLKMPSLPGVLYRFS
jgi:succinate dehydrogenase / fumarate reductase iron-sulfur subunit